MQDAVMHVISRKKLRDFWSVHQRARQPLEAWFQLARRSKWKTFAEVKASCPAADVVGKWVVFDIGGNKYRLIAAVHYNRGKLYVRHVLTHAEYDTDAWKNG